MTMIDTEGALDGLDDEVRGVMERWKVPGLSLAVVCDGKVLLQKGYGYRDQQKQLPVTTRTLFAIGSSSKAFTTLAMGTLADEGKLDWDTSVRNYLPWFAMYDPIRHGALTPRDLVTHRSGLPRYDTSGTTTPPRQRRTLERFRYLPPSADFRTVWQYQNLMFFTAGYLAGEWPAAIGRTGSESGYFGPLRHGQRRTFPC